MLLTVLTIVGEMRENNKKPFSEMISVAVVMLDINKEEIDCVVLQIVKHTILMCSLMALKSM